MQASAEDAQHSRRVATPYRAPTEDVTGPLHHTMILFPGLSKWSSPKCVQDKLWPLRTAEPWRGLGQPVRVLHDPPSLVKQMQDLTSKSLAGADALSILGKDFVNFVEL